MPLWQLYDKYDKEASSYLALWAQSLLCLTVNRDIIDPTDFTAKTRLTLLGLLVAFAGWVGCVKGKNIRVG